jgi:hypothetical protein
MTSVLLQGGPAHGATVDCDGRSTLALTGHGVPEGYVARYRPRDARRAVSETYRFECLSKIQATIPTPAVAGGAR